MAWSRTKIRGWSSEEPCSFGSRPGMELPAGRSPRPGPVSPPTGAAAGGLAPAVGEAIAGTQVIAGGIHIAGNNFGPSDTLASKIAASYQGAASGLEQSSLLFLGAVLLVINPVVNFIAQLIVRAFDPLKGAR